MDNLGNLTPVANQVPDAQPIINQPRGGSGARKWLLLGGLVFFLVIVGVGGWWYYAQGQALLLSRDVNFQWSKGIKNYKIEANYTLNIKDSKEAGESSNFFAGSAYLSNISIVGKISHHNVGENFVGLVDFTISQPSLNNKKAEDLIMKADYKKVDNNLYLKPDLDSLESFFSASLGMLNNPQAVLGLKLAQQENINLSTSTNPFTNSFSASYLTLSPLDSLVDQWVIFSIPTQKVEVDNKILLEDYNEKINEIINKLKAKKVFTIEDLHQIKDTKDGKLKGLKYSLKEGKLEDFYNIVAEATNSKYRADSLQKEKPETWNDFESNIKKISLIFWINTKTKNLQGVDLEVKGMGDTSGVTSIKDFDMTFSYLITTADAIDISVPTETITGEQYISALLSQMIFSKMGTSTEGLDLSPSGQDSDNDGLSDDLEAYYGTDPLNPDTDGDGYSDGQEVESGYNPLGAGKLSSLGL